MAFVEGQFRQIEGLTRTACEIWLKNEVLPNRESLKELYSWFLKERGIERMEAMEDLKLLKEHLQEIKEESFYSQKEEHCYINKQANIDIRQFKYYKHGAKPLVSYVYSYAN